MQRADRIALLEEAVALEKAGGAWTLQHVAALTGYSDRFLRASDLPKAHEEGHGATGKARIVYIPADVREWMRKRQRKAS
jgi:hypothetical protein